MRLSFLNPIHIQTNPFSVLISTINQGLQSRKTFVMVPYTSSIMSLLDCLYKKNIINSYKMETIQPLKGPALTYIVIYLLYYQNSNVCTRIKSYFLPSRKLYISYNELISKKYINQHSHMLLSTSRGYLWINECIKYKIGGIIMLEIL